MSHENGGWMNEDQRDATKPHECFGLNADYKYCAQCGWPLKPGFPIKGKAKESQKCSEDPQQQPPS